MKIRSCLLSLAAGVLMCGFATMEAKAATLVTNDQGTYNYSMTSTPLGGGMQTVHITFSGAFLTGVNTTNLSPVDYISSTLSPLTIASTGGPSTFDPFSGSGTKALGTVGDISYSTVSATATDGFLNITATIPTQTVTTPIMVVGGTPYDFSSFNNGGTMILSPQHNGIDIGAFIVNGYYLGAHGAHITTLTGSGSFSETPNAVPEPASLALLGIGMTGFLAFRRFFKKTTVA